MGGGATAVTSAKGQSLKPKRLIFHSLRASSFFSWRENPSFSVSDRISLDRSLIKRVFADLQRGEGGARRREMTLFFPQSRNPKSRKRLNLGAWGGGKICLRGNPTPLSALKFYTWHVIQGGKETIVSSDRLPQGQRNQQDVSPLASDLLLLPQGLRRSYLDFEPLPTPPANAFSPSILLMSVSSKIEPPFGPAGDPS